MSADVRTPDDQVEAPGASPVSPFVMLGDEAELCVDGVCAVPGTAVRALDT